MAITETPPAEANYSSVESFLVYHDRDLPIEDILAIPRRPELLDLSVSNPEAFSRPYPVAMDEVTKIASGIYSPKDGKIFEGDFAENELDPELYAPYVPIIEAILADAQARGVDIDTDKITISLKQGTGDQELRYLGQAHIDQGFGAKTKFIYIVSDRVPTEFYSHAFDAHSHNIDKVLAQQQAEAQVFRAEPFKVAMFDSTMPHGTPPELAGDKELRTVLRVWISEPNPYRAQPTG